MPTTCKGAHQDQMSRCAPDIYSILQAGPNNPHQYALQLFLFKTQLGLYVTAAAANVCLERACLRAPLVLLLVIELQVFFGNSKRHRLLLARLDAEVLDIHLVLGQAGPCRADEAAQQG